MSEEEESEFTALPDNVVPVLRPDGSILLKTLRGGRSKEMVLMEAALHRQVTGQTHKQSHCFSMQIEGKAGVASPLFMTPFQGTVVGVQVKRSLETEQPLNLTFEASLTALKAGFTLNVPKGGAGFVKKGNQLPRIAMQPMTPLIVTPDRDETFWLNIIFKEGRKPDAGEITDSGEDLSAGTED